MPGKLSFDDLDLREEPGRNSATPHRVTGHCTTTDYCTNGCGGTEGCSTQTTKFC